VREEVETMAWGKQESQGAGRVGPVVLWAHGVRRVGPVRISVERHFVPILVPWFGGQEIPSFGPFGLKNWVIGSILRVLR
jgi:hypothetical protein